MTTAQFKKIARILKAAYKKVEEQARKNGMDLMSKEYEALIDRVRETVLREMGFTLAEYRKVKAKVDPKSSYEIEEAEHIERSALPFHSEMMEIATRVSKDLIPPPKTVKQIFKYDDSKIQKGLKELSDKVSKTVTQEELKARAEELKTEILTWNADNFSANFKKNIDILGMPDFRKLAMGLQAQIDDINTNGIEGAGDVTGPASSTDNAIARFDGTTGKTLQNSGVTIDDSDKLTAVTLNASGLTASEILGTNASKDVVSLAVATYPSLAELAHVKGVTSAIQTQLGTKAGTALDNLASVAINTTLASDTDNTDDLGTTLKKWANLFVTTIGATATRVTKGWFTDIESTNMPTVGGTAILTSLTAPQFTTIELGHASDTTLSRSAAGVLAVEGVNVLTVAGGTLTGNLTLGENTSVDLDPALSADGKYSGHCITGTAGTTLAFGDLIYLAAADSRWELADADAATTADRLLGMCVLAAAADGDPTKILLWGNIRADAAFPALTIGSPVYVGETAGDIQTAIPTGADNVIRRVGYALTADELYFNPSMDSQVTVA